MDDILKNNIITEIKSFMDSENTNNEKKKKEKTRVQEKQTRTNKD